MAGKIAFLMVVGKHTFFSINGDASLTLQDIILQNGYANRGGAISNDGTLTLNNSTFTGNSAQHGGAISNSRTLTISNTTFTENSADFGGAIHNFDVLTITDSVFTENTARFGGAISNFGTLTITNGTFTKNVAKEEGGAIRTELTVTPSSYTATIADSTFSDNLSLGVGDALFALGSASSENSLYENNACVTDEGFINNGGNTAENAEGCPNG
ncbi:MAG: hypothetical protein SFZ02_15590 [bacterium]|nr:hypothetical protein [bacterium]